ncbi:MAG: galactose mutarotase [Chitinophagaceae bacterium]|nr:galactose mutarotase [Chitinophagaceae bacterium]
MSVKKQYCYTDSSGQEIYLFTLTNLSGTEVLITNYGATITSFCIKNKEGVVNDIVLGFDKVEDYTNESYLAHYPWFGCAVGRNANRIKNAKFLIDKKEYLLSKNNGNDQLHGGVNGFDKKVWQLIKIEESPVNALELKYISPDNEEGYPGKLDVVIRFELNNENELSYEYSASCDRPTVVNLTHHSYFNLNNGIGDIKDHEVRIYGSWTLDQDDNLVVNGDLSSVADTEFDFHEFTALRERLSKIPEYDKSFVADKDAVSLSLMAEARSVSSGVLLQVYSTEPIVHFYSGKWIPVIAGKNGIKYGPFSGLCLETHKHPNAINISHFPDTVLRPGEIYSSKTVYKVFS